MGRYIMSPRAQRGLDRIEDHLVENSPAAAPRIHSEILRHCQLLADNPHIGRQDPDLPGRNTRTWPVEDRYLILHRPIRGGIRVVAIEDGRQDPRRLFPRRAR